MSLDESVRVLSQKPFQVSTAKIRRVAIVKTLWYPEIISELEKSARDFLILNKIEASCVETFSCPGSFELPLFCDHLYSDIRAPFDFVVALGVVVRGGTPHFDYVCQNVSRGLMEISLKYQKPIGFGVLTVDSIEQATARTQKGAEAAHAALWMWQFMNQIKSNSKEIGISGLQRDLVLGRDA